VVWKISPTPGFDPWTLEPVPSRYTDYAIPALKSDVRNTKGAVQHSMVAWV